jgi:hypothetical protein
MAPWDRYISPVKPLGTNSVNSELFSLDFLKIPTTLLIVLSTATHSLLNHEVGLGICQGLIYFR